MSPREVALLLLTNAIHAGLTRRQLEVSVRAALGRTKKEIATELGLSVATVDVILQRVYKRLDVHSQAELAWRLLLEEDWRALSSVLFGNTR